MISNWTLGLVAVAILAVQYFEFKDLRQRLLEFRTTTDYQLGNLRYQLEQVSTALEWVEPQLELQSMNMWVAARHTQLKSMEDVIAAVDSGKYRSARVPLVDYRAARPAGSASQPSATAPAVGSGTTQS